MKTVERLRWVLLPLAAAALLVRELDLMLHPRFWAEEATVYFAAALAEEDLGTLLTATHLGYYSLLANLAAALAARVPLEQAPAVTLALAVATQLAPIALVCLGRAPIWATVERKTVASLILLVFGATGELHLNIVTAHFHMAVLAALIYVETDHWEGGRRSAEGALIGLLGLAGFSSLQACVLMPAFWLRSLRRRRRVDRVASLVMTAAAIAQSAAVILGGGGATDRFAPPEEPAARLGAFLLSMVRYPLFGDISDRGGWLLVGVVAVGSVAFLVFQVRLAWRGPHRDWLAIAWMVTAASVLASRRMAGGDRYQLLACVLLGLLLLAVAVERRQPVAWRRLAAGLLVAGLLVQTALWPARLAGSYDPDWPRWRDEVRAWHAGERDMLRIHPQWSGAEWVFTPPDRLRDPEP